MSGEEQVLRAVEILRGTSYDFQVEATTDVVALYGPDVLVAALERLDDEIEPGPRRRPLEQSGSSRWGGPERRFEATEEARLDATGPEQPTLPGPDHGTRMALPDVQATLGEFLAIALPYVNEANTRKLANAVFARFDAINAAARPAQKGEKVLSAEETRRRVGQRIVNGLRDRGIGTTD